MLKRSSVYQRSMAALIIITALFNILACSKSFCDAYTENIYGVVADIGARITDGIPQAVGEIMMYVVIAAAGVFVILVIFLVFFRKRDGYVQFFTRYMKCMFCIFVIVLFVYTFNWVIPLRSSLLGMRGEVEECIELIHKNYSAYSSDDGSLNDTAKENEVLKNDIMQHLWIIRTYIVDSLNELADEVPRDSDGRIIYSDKEEAEKKVVLAMQGLSDEFPGLSGFYPRLKFALCSELLNYMWIGGYTYPYTMEVTGNKYTDKLYYPSLYAHESAHHQGYYRENEANLLEFLGCINSDDKVIRYSGYISMYYYIDEAYSMMLSEMNDDNLWKEYNSVCVSEKVWTDSRQSIDESDEEFANADKPMQQFEDEVSDVADLGWDTQDELLGENSYDGVADLMLWYYEGKLY